MARNSTTKPEDSATGDGVQARPIETLVASFGAALLAKLTTVEATRGAGDPWLATDWQDQLNAALVECVEKGDPLDVAAYCAFAWHHGWHVALPVSAAQLSELTDGLESLKQLLADPARAALLGDDADWSKGAVGMVIKLVETLEANHAALAVASAAIAPAAVAVSAGIIIDMDSAAVRERLASEPAQLVFLAGDTPLPGIASIAVQPSDWQPNNGRLMLNRTVTLTGSGDAVDLDHVGLIFPTPDSAEPAEVVKRSALGSAMTLQPNRSIELTPGNILF